MFCVVSRYHGGAFVVFSGGTQRRHLEVAAIEGSHASVIGGAPAAAVVFAREVRKRTGRGKTRDVRSSSQAALADAKWAETVPIRPRRLDAELEELRQRVHAEKLGEVADEFDGIHSVHRARDVGSVHEIIPAARLRPYLVEALERGMTRIEARMKNG